MTAGPAEAVSGNCYALLGVTASIGRTITTDDEPGAGDPAHAVRSLVSDVPASTTMVLTVTALAIAAVATLVSAWPAARAARIDAARALHDE